MSVCQQLNVACPQGVEADPLASTSTCVVATRSPALSLQAELMFEKYGAPAWYSARSPVLGAFSVGRASAVVIDIGAGSTRVAPVYDGYVLNKGTHLSEVGGNFLTRIMPGFLTTSTGMPVLPRYCFKKVQRAAGSGAGEGAAQPPAPFADAPDVVAASAVGGSLGAALPASHLRSAVTVAPPSASRVFDIVRKDVAGVTRSFHDAAVWEVMEDMKRALLEVHEVGFDPDSTPSQVHYELPDGHLLRVKSMRFQLSEAHFRADIVESFSPLLFSPPFSTPALHALTKAGVITRPTVPTSSPHLPQSLPAMVYGALLACTPEARRDLCQHSEYCPRPRAPLPCPRTPHDRMCSTSTSALPSLLSPLSLTSCSCAHWRRLQPQGHPQALALGDAGSSSRRFQAPHRDAVAH